MPRNRTRAQLRERAKRLGQRNSDIGAYTDARWNRTLAESWATVWYVITSKEEGYGQKWRTITVATAGPTLDVPTEFLDLRSLERGADPSALQSPDLVSPASAQWRGLQRGEPAGRPGYYAIEGPMLDDDGTTQIPQRFRFWPNLGLGELLEINYVTHEPTLGDPDNAGEDTTSIDVISEPLEKALCTYAWSRAVSREDQKDYARALADMERSIDAYLQTIGRRNKLGVRSADLYVAHTGRWHGYGQ